MCCKGGFRRVILVWVCTAIWLLSSSMSAEAAPTSSSPPFVIRIDTAHPRLQVFSRGRLYRTYPIALGKVATETPIGSWHVVDKQQGWGAGFGTRWMGLDVPWGIYGIHGTNQPSSIGSHISGGCIRMLNPDVEQLYRLIPIGTPVIVTGNVLQHLRTLEYGHIGADVQWVQQRLQQAGYYRGPCDGRFEQATEFGLLYYELSRGIPMDGVVGLDDYRALRQV